MKTSSQPGLFASLSLAAVLAGATVLAAAGCGSTASANGQNNTPGGAPGNPCNAATSPVGCWSNGDGTSTVVNCPADVSPATWVAGASCGAGTHCAVTSKTEASCVANPVTTVNDTVSGSDTKTGDAGGVDKCIEQKCAAKQNACITNVKCTAFFTCLSQCKDGDQTCQDTCAAPLKSDPAAAKTASDYLECAMQAGFDCSGFGGDASTSGDASAGGDAVP